MLLYQVSLRNMLGWTVCVQYWLKLIHALARACSRCHTLWQPQAEADYRMNGANVLKRHRHQYESCHRNVMNLQSNYHTGEHTVTQQRTHVGAHTVTSMYIHTNMPLWVIETFGYIGCYSAHLSFKSENCAYSDQVLDHTCQPRTKDALYPLAAGTDTWSRIDMYRSDDNSWNETDGEKDTCAWSRQFYYITTP